MSLPVTEVEHQWITMPDGVRLSARLWISQGEPCPAILEYIPYRKRDMVRARDERNHLYFARHGYVCIRVDMRGSGDSEGIMPDMYHQNELDDARHVINWIARQPWCNGRVGMFGTSWGGTASLQASVEAPEPLKAVIANCATIDRFEDDIHWMGGCLLTDSMEWGATLPAILASPPDSATLGNQWWDIWQARLAQIAFPFEYWVKNNQRGDYWRHGSVRFQPDRLTCPILAIGGWSDRYSNSVMRLARARPDICKGIVGPWGHHYPDRGEPGPAMNFQKIALMWWDYWLKSKQTNVQNWPNLQLWQREYDPPQNRLSLRQGRWISLDKPSSAEESSINETRELYLGDHSLSFQAFATGEKYTVPFDLRHGECAGDTGYFGRVGGLPLDQAPDDARSLCFDSLPLEEDIELVGHVTLSAEIETDQVPAQIACRLCEVTPEGCSNLVTRTVLALELDESLDHPRALHLNTPTRYRIEFPATAYRFQKGHRLRLAIGASYWPLVFPAWREPSRLTIHAKDAILSLPKQLCKEIKQDSPLRMAENLPDIKTCDIITKGELERTKFEEHENVISGGWHQPELTMKFTNIDLEFSYETTANYTLNPHHPDIATCSMEHKIAIQRPDGIARIHSRLVNTKKPDGLSWKADLSVQWNDKIIKETSATGHDK